MKVITIQTVIGLLLLTGCIPANDNPTAADVATATETGTKASLQEADDHANNLGTASKEHFYSMTDHVADWMRPNKPKPSLTVKASYCYYTYQDILCYRQPMPGWENRLVAYQPLDAPPPPPAVMKPLAQVADDTSKLPTNRVASAQPVFVSPPPEVKATEKKDGTTEPIADTAHESMPDPTLAPQL